MLSGSLSEINLAEILQLLHSSNQTGVLMLTEEGNPIGAIYLQVGEFTHAEAGAATGLDALNALVGASKATFAFQAGVNPPQQSLSPYPTAKLLEKLQRRIAEVIELAAALPKPSDVPKYIATAAGTSIQASPQELALLIMSNGSRTVAEIAAMANQTVTLVSETLAKFRQVNMVEIVTAPPPPATPPPAAPAAAAPAAPAAGPPPIPTGPSGTTPENAGGTPDNADGVRYWRGKRIN
jgi:Domain of unknown function (DUF4388)